MPKSRPILVVNLKDSRRMKVAYALAVRGLSCTDEQADQLASHIGHLPADPHKLFDLLEPFVQVDWDRCPDRLEVELRELARRWNEAAEGPRRMIESEMILLTRGLVEHPEGWEWACDCDLCRSYGQ